MAKRLSKRERKVAAQRAQRAAEMQQRIAERQARREAAQTRLRHEPERSSPHATSPFDASPRIMALIQLHRTFPALQRALQTVAQPLGTLTSTPDCDESLVAVHQLVEMLVEILPDLQSKVVEPLIDEVSAPDSATQAA